MASSAPSTPENNHLPLASPSAPAKMEYLRGRHQRPFNNLPGKDALKIAEMFGASSSLLPLSDGQKLEVHDFIPEHENGNPIVFVSGYYAEGDTWRNLMYDMYLQERRSLCINAYHGIEPSQAFRTRYADKIAELVNADLGGPDIEPQLRKAAALIEMLDAKGLQSVDILGNSEGCIVSTIALYLRPDLFANKAFLSPAGMIGDRTVKEIMGRKMTEDLVVARQRIEMVPETIATSIHAGIQSLMPEGVMDPAPEHPLRFRQFSGKYHEQPAADLSAGQYIQAKGTFRAWSDWLKTQLSYFSRLKDEYGRGIDAKRLKDELCSLSERRLDRWLGLPGINKSNLTIGAAERDQLYPPKEVALYAGKAGISYVTVIEDATHGVHHFQPDKVHAFLMRALKIGENLMVQDTAVSGDTIDHVAGHRDEIASTLAEVQAVKTLHALSL